jgi:peptidoglycan/xylan/chitin deacetylase (PgdA/CDA1 family)
MYHDVADAPPPGASAGADAYRVSVAAFRRQLDALAACGVPARAPGAALRDAPDRGFVVTFDDGWLGTFRGGLAELARRGWPGIVFVTRDFVGRRGFADRPAIRDAVESGFEIGVHGSTHRSLAGLPPDEVVRELRECRVFLEDITGAPVRMGSAPNGAWSPALGPCAARAGLEAMCTSRLGHNDARTDPMALRRWPVRARSTTRSVTGMCDGIGARERSEDLLLRAARATLGSHYPRLRTTLLDAARRVRRAG